MPCILTLAGSVATKAAQPSSGSPAPQDAAAVQIAPSPLPHHAADELLVHFHPSGIVETEGPYGGIQYELQVFSSEPLLAVFHPEGPDGEETDARLVLERSDFVVKDAYPPLSVRPGGALLRPRGLVMAVKTPSGMSLEDAKVLAESLPEVALVEYNAAYQFFNIPSDPQFGEQWALDNQQQNYECDDDPEVNVGADVNAAEAWELETGSSDVRVALLDTGVQLYPPHPDLADNLSLDGYDCLGPTIDEDGLGPCAAEDPCPVGDHGTWVAGVIGAVGNNALGISGVCWDVTIVPYRIGFNVIYSDQILTALDKAAEQGVVAINMSGGGRGPGAYVTAIYDRIQDLQDKNVLFVAAAGNFSEDADDPAHAIYPACFDLDNILSVAAISDGGGLHPISNYGAVSVDLGAPGAGIRTLHTQPPPNDYTCTTPGTSVAAPFVTGTAALIQSHRPGSHYRVVRNALLYSVDKAVELESQTASGGTLNMRAALEWLHRPDADADGDVDLRDVADFSLCWTDTSSTACAEAFDLNNDDRVDLSDWGLLQPFLMAAPQ